MIKEHKNNVHVSFDCVSWNRPLDRIRVSQSFVYECTAAACNNVSLALH